MKDAGNGATSRLLAALKDAESELNDAPEQVKTAAQTLFAYLRGVEPELADQLPDPISTTKAGEMNSLDLAIRAALNGHRITLT